MTLQPLPSVFPYIQYEENFVFFLISVLAVLYPNFFRVSCLTTRWTASTQTSSLRQHLATNRKRLRDYRKVQKQLSLSKICLPGRKVCKKLYPFLKLLNFFTNQLYSQFNQMAGATYLDNLGDHQGPVFSRGPRDQLLAPTSLQRGLDHTLALVRSLQWMPRYFI